MSEHEHEIAEDLFSWAESRPTSIIDARLMFEKRRRASTRIDRFGPSEALNSRPEEVAREAIRHLREMGFDLAHEG